MSILFFTNSLLLGAGLAMDAFSVSITNGLVYPNMRRPYRVFTAATYAFFQFLMPVIGWFCVSIIVEHSEHFRRLTPLISLLLLSYIGGSMIYEAAKEGGTKEDKEVIAMGRGPGLHLLILQGVATSIDALSVGFTIADYGAVQALTAALIIGLVTYIICYSGICIGRAFGNIVGNRATIIGGLILIGIGLEIYIRSL